MKLVGEDRGHERRSPNLGRGLISVHPSPSYDLLLSLRAVYNTDVWEHARRWAFAARKAMGPRLYSEGRFFFEGRETALGLGLLRLVPTLGAESGPAEFIECLRVTSAEECALLMLDTGETSQDTLDFYLSVIQQSNGHEQGLEAATRDFAGEFADRSLEVLRDPVGSKERLVKFLEAYLERVFASSVEVIRAAVQRAAVSARDLLAMQPTLSSIEALSGGYTLSAALKMNEITLAPSVFVYPFMAQRVDQRAGQALIVFGVRNDEILGYHESNSEDVLESVKVLANPHRLQMLTLLRSGPLLGSEFVRRLELSQPTVHHHLAQLRSTGLIRQERTKDGMLYSFRLDTAEALVAQLAEYFGLDSK